MRINRNAETYFVKWKMLFPFEKLLLMVTINNYCIFNNANRTEWSPIRSVIIRVITKSDDREAGIPDLLITSMITDWIGLHDALLSINHNNYNFPQKCEFHLKKGFSKSFLNITIKNMENTFQNSHRRLNLHNFTNSVSWNGYYSDCNQCCDWWI